MNNIHTNFGLSGFSEDNYDTFFGKRARSRRKERRARRKESREIRFEKRKLKNDDRRADTEAKRAETKVMKATMLPGSAPSSQPASTSAPLAAPQLTQTPNPPTQQAGFGNNTIMIVVGVLVVGGFLFMNKKGQPKTPITTPEMP